MLTTRTLAEPDGAEILFSNATRPYAVGRSSAATDSSSLYQSIAGIEKIQREVINKAKTFPAQNLPISGRSVEIRQPAS